MGSIVRLHHMICAKTFLNWAANRKPAAVVMSIVLPPKSVSKEATALPAARNTELTLPTPLKSSTHCQVLLGVSDQISRRTFGRERGSSYRYEVNDK